MKPEAVYQIELSETAVASLETTPKKQAGQILAKIERLEFGLIGNIKKFASP